MKICPLKMYFGMLLQMTFELKSFRTVLTFERTVVYLTEMIKLLKNLRGISSE
jgi:hypothetical protein